MSIESSVYADYAERKRIEWLKQLELAYQVRDWVAIAAVLKKMHKFRFTE